MMGVHTMMRNNATRIYTFPKKPDLMHIFIFVALPYREDHKLHSYHKRRRVWSYFANNTRPKAGVKRTRQIERWCRLSGAKLDESPFVLVPAD